MAQRIRLSKSTTRMKQRRVSRDTVQSTRAHPWLKQHDATAPHLSPVDSRAMQAFETQTYLMKDAFGRYIAL